MSTTERETERESARAKAGERETVSRALAERGISSERHAGGMSGRTSPMRVSSTADESCPRVYTRAQMGKGNTCKATRDQRAREGERAREKEWIKGKNTPSLKSGRDQNFTLAVASPSPRGFAQPAQSPKERQPRIKEARPGARMTHSLAHCAPCAMRTAH